MMGEVPGHRLLLGWRPGFVRICCLSGPALAGMMGTMAFAVQGYDADSREIYAIPEVRKFYGAFHRAWPY
jgi:hypothetical protein